jgi:cysteinyl-tRNA synthetase
MFSGKGRHEISKTSEDFPKISVDFRKKLEFSQKKFHETRQNNYRTKTACPFLSERQKNNDSKTGFFLTICKAINKNWLNCLNHDFHKIFKILMIINSLPLPLPGRRGRGERFALFAAVGSAV